MSYIDCFDHEHVGFFSGYPLYRPLEKHEPSDTLDGQFSCHEKNLIIGGGYLEHPGLVVRDLDYVAAHFIIEWIDYCDENKTSIYSEEDTKRWYEICCEYCFGKDQFKILESVQWSMRDYSDFYSNCKSKAMNSPFIETEQRNIFESWLSSNIGELVVFSFQDLLLNKEIASIAKKVDIYLYGNITILPAMYPTEFLGRKTINGESKQGHRSWVVNRNV